MTRIEGSDNSITVCMKMSEGNPGAMTVCLRLLGEAGDIDTDDFLGGLGPILMLDSAGVYGSRIWMLYKDVCEEELWKMIAVLRGWQLGNITQNQLNHAIDNRGTGIDLDAVIQQVTERLDGFKIPQEVDVNECN